MPPGIADILIKERMSIYQYPSPITKKTITLPCRDMVNMLPLPIKAVYTSTSRR
jgi:hypothetical protein